MILGDELYGEGEERELAQLDDQAIARFDAVNKAMVSLETQVAELAVSTVLGDAHEVRAALHHFASELSEKRHRIRYALVKEQRRRQGGKKA